MVSDLNKGITEIKYNSLNLPQSIAIDGKGSIEYVYSAAGLKLQTQHKTATTTYQSPLTFSTTAQADKVADYVGNKVYEDKILKRILIDGGYIEDGRYFYYLTDHLGNNRASDPQGYSNAVKNAGNSHNCQDSKNKTHPVSQRAIKWQNQDDQLKKAKNYGG